MDFIQRYETVYPVEIEVAFALDRARTDLMISELIKAKKITSQNVGNGERLCISDSAKRSPIPRRERKSSHNYENSHSKMDKTPIMSSK
jgi:hypothetical protein